ncbi:MAG: DUF4115 domain-containing protein [Synergistaceae bacterium]
MKEDRAEETVEELEKEMQMEKLEREKELISLGDKLRQIREAQSISHEDVFEKIKIQKHHLLAIEEGRIADLPKGPFVRSFIRQYCIFLSAEDIWKKYDSLTNKLKVTVSIPKESVSVTYKAPKHEVFKPSRKTLLYLFLAIIVILGLYFMYQNRQDFSQLMAHPTMGGSVNSVTSEDHQLISGDITLSEDSPVSGDALSTDVLNLTSQDSQLNGVAQPVSTDLGWLDGKPYKEPTKDVTPLSADKVKQEITVEKNKIKIIANSVIWVKVSRGNQTYFQGLVNPGEEKIYDVKEAEPLRIRYGNPGKTSIIFDGKTTNAVGVENTPITRFYWNDGRVTESK